MQQNRPVIGIGLGQIAAWGASTYLPAIIAKPIAEELGVSSALIFGAFSLSLLVMALCGPTVGQAIDRYGGRTVLCLSNIVLALGLVILGGAHSIEMVYVAWIFLGLGMALGLYDAAFAALVFLYREAARPAITGVTLFGGFASTVSWPLTSLIVSHGGWHQACFVWAAIQCVLILPIHLWCIPKQARRIAAASPHKPVEKTGAEPRGEERKKRALILLALFGAITSFVTSSMAAHLPGLLMAMGSSAERAIIAGALFGPAQVFARFSEYFLAKRFHLHPLVTARFATALHPLAGLCFLWVGGLPMMAMAFVVCHGAGNGLITIAKGTLPLVFFGAAGYGERQGMLAVAQRLTQAAAPFVFSWTLLAYGAEGALCLSIGLSSLAWLSLWGLQKIDAGSTPAH